jgi:pimeloyl-ACP methyl ester carboxylesterase
MGDHGAVTTPSANGEGWEPIEVRLDDDAAAHELAEQAAAAAAGVEVTADLIAFPSEDHEPVIGPGPEHARRARLPRLARHSITLADGHRVAVAVCGRGVPLVVVHGFTAEGILYAQTLSRLVSMGFKVVAIDVAGHGGTQGLPTGGANLRSYSHMLGQVLDALGIERAVLAGHSMGGRLVTQLAADEPERAIAVVLIDAIVGDTWDALVNASRLFPPLLGGLAGILVLDTLSTVPLFRDPTQAAKMARLVTPTLIGHVRRPWRLLGPAVSILRSRGSRWMLEKLAQERVPVFVVHGDRDAVVPLATGRAAARRSHGELVVVHRASHSWLLKDPEAAPAITAELLGGSLGAAIVDALAAAGVDTAELRPGTHPSDELTDAIEAALYSPGALVLELTPPPRPVDPDALRRPPRYRWSIERRPA